MRNTCLLTILAYAALLAGCTPPPHPPSPVDAANPLKRVAVLPMRNDTNDVDGPALVRKKMSEALAGRSYAVIATKDTDQLLRDQLGITLGGQLELTTPQQLGEVLQAEGVLYGTLMDFDETTTGMYNVKKVRAKFRLVNTRTGKVEWERGLGIRSEMHMSGSKGTAAAIIGALSEDRDKSAPWVTIESIQAGDTYKESLAIGLAARFLTTAMGIHLERESSELARRVTDDLRWGPGIHQLAPVAATVKPPVARDVRPPAVPSFGYLDLGKRDLTAVIVTRSTDRSGKEQMVMEVPFAKAGERTRMEMQLASTNGDGSVPSGISRIVTISQGDRKEMYTLYPNVKKYIVTLPQDAAFGGEQPKIERTKVGTETVDGHPADKYRIRMTGKAGGQREGFLWNARDLDGLTIKSVLDGPDGKVTTVLKNIVLKRPDNSLFEVPKDYTVAKDLLELIVDKQ